MDQVRRGHVVLLLRLVFGSLCGSGIFTLPVAAQMTGVGWWRVQFESATPTQVDPLCIGVFELYAGSIASYNVYVAQPGTPPAFIESSSNFPPGWSDLPIVLDPIDFLTVTINVGDYSYTLSANSASSDIIVFDMDASQYTCIPFATNNVDPNPTFAVATRITARFYPNTGPDTVNDGPGSDDPYIDPEDIDIDFLPTVDEINQQTARVTDSYGLTLPSGDDSVALDTVQVFDLGPMMNVLENQWGNPLDIYGVPIDRPFMAPILPLIHAAMYVAVHIWGVSIVFKEFRRA